MFLILDRQFNKIEALFNPNKMKVRTIPPVNAIPPKSYICKKCKKPGHYVYRCPNGAESAEAQFSHVKLVGIPLKNLMIIDDPSTVTVELSMIIIVKTICDISIFGYFNIQYCVTNLYKHDFAYSITPYLYFLFKMNSLTNILT